MKIPSKQKRSPKLLIAIIIALLVVAGYGAASYAIHIWPFPDNTTNQSTKSQEQDNKDNSNPSVKDNAPTSTSNKNVDATKSSDDIPQNTSLALTITDLSESNNAVNYRANLSDSNQDGSCVAEFTTDGEKPVTSTTNASKGVCGPVSIPVSEFTKLGTWTLTLHYYVNNTQVIATKTIDIR